MALSNVAVNFHLLSENSQRSVQETNFGERIRPTFHVPEVSEDILYFFQPV